MEDAIVWEPVWRQEYVAVTRQYGFGTDAMLLADFAAPKRTDRAADLGCGTGAIATLMAAHCPVADSLTEAVGMASALQTSN